VEALEEVSSRSSNSSHNSHHRNSSSHNLHLSRINSHTHRLHRVVASSRRINSQDGTLDLDREDFKTCPELLCNVTQEQEQQSQQLEPTRFTSVNFHQLLIMVLMYLSTKFT